MSYKQKAAASRAAAKARYADGGAVAAAKTEAGRRIREREEQGSGMTLRERDQRDSTEDAVRSGDYAPDERGNYRFKPWSPRR